MTGVRAGAPRGARPSDFVLCCFVRRLLQRYGRIMEPDASGGAVPRTRRRSDQEGQRDPPSSPSVALSRRLSYKVRPPHHHPSGGPDPSCSIPGAPATRPPGPLRTVLLPPSSFALQPSPLGPSVPSERRWCVG
jgi:hypothetical protein